MKHLIKETMFYLIMLAMIAFAAYGIHRKMNEPTEATMSLSALKIKVVNSKNKMEIYEVKVNADTTCYVSDSNVMSCVVKGIR